jgi:hypothetical protein
MSLLNNKSDVFTTIGAYSSLMQTGNMPNQTNLFPSINNSKDVVPYLLDVLKVVSGTDALQDLTGELFTNFIDDIEPKLKEAVKKQTVQYNSNDPIPEDFKTKKLRVKVKDIDTYDKYKVNPETAIGSLLYAGASAISFDKQAFQAILNNGTPSSFGPLNIAFDAATDEFLFSPNLILSPNPSISGFLGDYVDKMTIINKKEFMTNVMNQFYGTITKDQKKTIEQVYQELEVNKLIDQLINDNDSYLILPKDYDELLNQAQQLVNGVVYYDLGCGVMTANLSLSGLTSLLSQISGSTDPFFIGNKIYGTVEESTSNTPETSAENKQTVKDNFFQKLIKIITQMVALSVTTSPQIRALLSISSSLQDNGTTLITTAKEDLKNFKIFIQCLIKDSMKLINEFIFNFIAAILIKLIKVVTKKVTKEKINQYVDGIKTLTSTPALTSALTN